MIWQMSEESTTVIVEARKECITYEGEEDEKSNQGYCRVSDHNGSCFAS